MRSASLNPLQGRVRRRNPTRGGPGLRGHRLGALLLSVAVLACDDSAAVDRGVCAVDEDCAATDVCFDGRCIFQGETPAPGEAPGDEPPAPPPGPPPAEVEVLAGTRPAAGLRQVWIASPTTDTVVHIDAETLELGLVEVGDRPDDVRAQPGREAVVVLAEGSDTLHAIELLDGEPAVQSWRLPHHYNTLDLSPDGRSAWCWMDLSQARPGEDTGAVQQLTIVDLVRGEQLTVTVGFRPERLVFTPEGQGRLLTADGLSIIDDEARERGVAPLIPLALDPLSTAAREVVLTPDGRWAISRAADTPGLTVVDLEEGTPRLVDLGEAPTDLDLMPDGATVLAMLPESRALALVPIATAVDAPDGIRRIDVPRAALNAAVIGPNARRALLYTTADHATGDSLAALLDVDGGAVIYLPLRKAARGAAIDPSGRVAYVLHARATPAELDEAGIDPTSPEAAIAGRHGFSLVELDTGFAKLETTDAPPGGLVFAPDQPLALLHLADAERGVADWVRVRLDDLGVERRALASTPEVIGLLPSVSRAFVTQQHPTGRISFLPLDRPDAPLETVTGYALNGRIE